MSHCRMEVLALSWVDYSQAFPPFLTLRALPVMHQGEMRASPAEAFTPGTFLPHEASDKERQYSQNAPLPPEP